MKIITIKDIRNLDPCYDPVKYLPENWVGTIEDLLYIKDCPIEDIFWVVLREEFLPEFLLHEFACCCAEDVLHLYELEYPSDNRPRNAIEAKRYWCISQDETTLSAARSAESAARSAAWSAARSVQLQQLRELVHDLRVYEETTEVRDE